MNAGGRLIIVRMILLAITSSLVLFSTLDFIRKFVTGNLIYLAVFFFGFISDMFIKQLSKFKNIANLLKFLDELYNFIRTRKL
jgi:hypothetical protein